jgi:hypothetical protein
VGILAYEYHRIRGEEYAGRLQRAAHLAQQTLETTHLIGHLFKSFKKQRFPLAIGQVVLETALSIGHKI